MKDLLRRSLARLLRKAGFIVDELADGRSVEVALTSADYDVVLSDIVLPGMDGIQVLQTVRQRDPDLPVVLMTAGADLRTAMEAVEHGALHYLLKPVDPTVLSEIADDAVRLRRLARVKRRAFEMYGDDALKQADQGGLSDEFDRAMQGLHMAYQPIVRWSDRTVFSWEALVRTEEASLRRPDLLFAAAEQLGRLHTLGQAIRRHVANTLTCCAIDEPVFVNLHPRDLEDDDLLAANSPLSAFASRTVLEITERAALETIDNVSARLATLRRLGYRLALDDLGAGYAGLSSIAQLHPHVVKLDMSLVRGVETDATKQKLVRTMVDLCGQLGMLVVAEGVETATERDHLVALGCDLLQGFLFAKPGPPFPQVRWDASPPTLVGV